LSSVLTSPPRPATPDDAALPHLEILLDAERLGDLLGLATPLRITYVRYKPGWSCLARYETIESRPHTGYAKVFSQAPHDSAKRSPGWEYHPDLHIGVARFPFDRKIPALSLAFDRDRGEAALEAFIDESKRDRYRADWGQLDVLRYKPERRCVLAGSYRRPGEPAARRFFARFYASGEGEFSAQWYWDLHRACRELGGGVDVPRPLGKRAKHRLLILKDSGGESLENRLSADSAGEAVSAAAQALAKFHRLPAPANTPLAETGLAARRSVEAIEGLLGNGAGGAAALANRLSETPPATVQTLVHGDFYHDQVTLRPDGRVHLLDVDELAIGNPIADVANFCAHLDVLALNAEILPERARVLQAAFLGSYEAEAAIKLGKESFPRLHAEALLTLAVKPFREFQSNWPDRMEQILDRAWRAWSEPLC